MDYREMCEMDDMGEKAMRDQQRIVRMQSQLAAHRRFVEEVEWAAGDIEHLMKDIERLRKEDSTMCYLDCPRCAIDAALTRLKKEVG